MADVYMAKRSYRDVFVSKYSSHSGDIVVEIIEAPNGFNVERIYAASPTAANFNAAPVGSWLIDTALPHVIKIHDTATTWKTLTGS